MSFLRVEKKDSGTYLRILESYRDANGVSKHRILHTLGKVEDYSPEQLRSIGIKFFQLGGGDIRAMLDGELVELGRYNYGYQQIYGKALSHYGISDVLRRISKKSKLQFDLFETVKLLLLERLQEPCSKHYSFYNQQEYVHLPKVALHHLYRALDKLADNHVLIQQQIFQTGRDLFNQQLDVVFYDVTTLYFESEVEQEGALRQKGFSKDGKIGNTQILFCMLIDVNKNPIGYRIFEGNTYEGHTFEKALDDLKKQFSIEKIIVVADRGMLSKSNITLTNNKGYEFILGERIKSLPKKVQVPLLDISSYDKEWIYTDNDNEKVVIKYKTIVHEQRTIIATYSTKRAKKDEQDREDKIATAKKLLENTTLITKKAQRFYITQKEEGKYELNHTKATNDAMYDGILAISTNNTELPIATILDQYKQLYKIEHTFRTFKSHLEIRPMYHWTDKRIKGHICLCYIAYTLLNFVLQKANAKQKLFTENSLRKILDKMQVSLVQHNEKNIYIRSAQSKNEAYLQQQLGLKSLQPITPQHNLQF
jgi:transposase